MAGTNFLKLLETAGFEIRKSIDTKYESSLKLEEEKYYDTDQDQIFKDQIIKLESEEKKINMQIDALKHKRKQLIPALSFEGKQWLDANGYSTRNKNEVDYLAVKALHDTPLYTNKEEFTKINSRFYNAMNLAVTSKEKRDILLSYYNLDWKSL